MLIKSLRNIECFVNISHGMKLRALSVKGRRKRTSYELNNVDDSKNFEVTEE